MFKSKKLSQAKPDMRKAPVQKRALNTVDTIIEAATQIIEDAGLTAFTTNQVAKIAGFSVGTLYQYFPSKDAILTAIVERKRKTTFELLQKKLDHALQNNMHPEEMTREMVQVVLQTFCGGGRLQRSLMHMGWMLEHHESVTKALREGADMYAVAISRINHPSMRPVNHAMMYVAGRALIGVIRSAILEESPLLGTLEFEDELVRLVMGIHSVGTPNNPVAKTQTELTSS